MSIIKVFIIIGVLAIITACGTPKLPTMAQELISFQTSDRVTIVGDWSMPTGAKKAVLLLHMMPANRSSWQPLSKSLSNAGIATLAIDLRGHGESTERLDYQNFSDAQHQASRLDVDAALNFLKSKGFDESAISVVGASIGANLALDAMARYSGIAHGVLLSPGLNYRSVLTETPMKNLAAHQKVWLVAARSDNYSAETVMALHALQPDTSTLTVFEGSQHGTNLFKSEKKLVDEIVKFLNYSAAAATTSS